MKFWRWLCLAASVCLWCEGGSLRAQSLLTNTTPVGFFTNTANLLLKTSGFNFTVANIPIYPTNCYTPAVNRLLQLAVNMYDASTNRVFEDGTSPNGPYYPSVFRPTFSGDGTNVFITGYVEDVSGGTGSNKNYLLLPLSLPEDLASVNSNTVNIYGIPWIIGARKGFPNFNELSMQCFSQITRAVQIVKPSLTASQSAWMTNIQYSIGISNVIGVEAWNSYSNIYPRAIDIIGADYLSMYLTNELGILLATNITPVNPLSPGLFFGPLGNATLAVEANQWAGFTANVANPKFNLPSFQVPLFTNVIFLSNQVYHPNSNPWFNSSNVFDQGLGYIQPLFGLNLTNRLRFVMVDHATGRVIDIVQFNGMNFHRDLTGELMGGNGGDGGIWDTNRLTYPTGMIRGVNNQILISKGLSVSGYPSFTTADWIYDQLQPTSQAEGVQAFNAFVNGETTNLEMQTPFKPTRALSVSYTWQANDPLVHYLLEDLTQPLNFQTNYLTAMNTVTALANIGLVNLHYLPWGNRGNAKGLAADSTNAYNLAVKDPLISQSDAWQFSTNGFPSLAWLANVHRGTPWQTVYLKSATTSLGNWEYWTGDMEANDAQISEPTNDWNLVAALLPALTPADPHTQYGYNNPSAETLFPAFEGLTVFTNVSTSILSPIVIDEVANSNAVAQVISGIDTTRGTLLGGVFTNIGQILATPQLSQSSPFINLSGNIQSQPLTDAAYECLPAQLLPLLRPDSIGTVMNTGGQPAIQFTGIDGYGYIIQSSTNLQDWTAVATLYPTNGILNFTDTNANGIGERYYRTLLAP